MKVKLSKDNVINGGVWGKDSIVEVSQADGAALIANGDAVEVKEAPQPAAKPAPAKEKLDK